MGLQSNQISAGFSQPLCHHRTSKQSTSADWRGCSWVGVNISPLVARRVPSGTKNSNPWGLKILRKWQLYFFVFSELRRCCLQQHSLTTSLWRATYSFGNWLSDCSYGAPLVKAQLYVTHSWRLPSVTTDVQLGLCLPHYLAISFRLPWYVNIFKEASTELGFHTTPRKSLILAIAISYPHSPSFSIFHTCSSCSGVPTPVHPQLCVLFPFPRKISCAPPSALLYTSVVLQTVACLPLTLC